MSAEMDEVIKRLRELGFSTAKLTPEWLDYGFVCNHDEGYLCEHRFEHLIQTIEGLKPEFKHTKFCD